MRFALATAGDQARPGVLGLDAVPQPVRASRRARLEVQRLGQPPRVGTLRVGVGLVAVAHLLGQVLGQVADAPRRILRAREHAVSAELNPEPGHMPRLVLGADGIKAAPLRSAAARIRAGLCLGGPPGAARARHSQQDN